MIAQITDSFDLDSVFSYNVLNVGRAIVNNLENTVIFCCEVGVLRSERKCKGCLSCVEIAA